MQEPLPYLALDGEEFSVLKSPGIFGKSRDYLPLESSTLVRRERFK